MYTKLVFINTWYQIVSRGLSVMLSLALSVMIVRTLGIDQFGNFSLVLSYIAIFLAISDFGANSNALKYFSDSDYFRKNFFDFIIFRLLISIFSLGIYFLVLPIMGFSLNVVLTISIGAPLLILNAFTKSFMLLFQARKDFKDLTLSSIMTSIFGIIALVSIVYVNKLSLETGILLILFQNLLGVVFLLLKYSSEIDFKPSFNWKYYRFLLSDSWIVGVTMIINMLMVNIDRIMMNWLSNPIEIGYYSMAYRFFDLILILPTYLMNIYYPILIDHKEKSADYSLLFQSILKKFVFVGVLLSVISILIAPILSIIWEGFNSEVVLAFRLLSIGIVFFFLTSPLNWRLVLHSKRSNLIFIYLIGLFVNISLNYLFLSSYGYKAAAFSTISAEIVVLAGLLYSNIKTKYVSR